MAQADSGSGPRARARGGQLTAVCRAAEDAARLGAGKAIASWLRRFIEYVATKRAVATGQDAGAMRRDVDIDDVMRFAMAYTTANFASPEQRDRMLAVAFDGLAAQTA